MRELVFDTETTGLDPLKGDRLVEIGLIELVNHIPTGRNFHRYINPERLVPDEVVRIHGLDDAFLADKPVFNLIAGELVEFIGDGTLIAHNATFDMLFLNTELGRLGHEAIGNHRVIDTLALARRRHPAGPNSLDALCSRYQIDTSRRVYHGALLDAELLAEVYIELIGGRQSALGLGDIEISHTIAAAGPAIAAEQRPVPLPSAVLDSDRAAHAAMIEKMGEKAVWRDYLAPAGEGA